MLYSKIIFPKRENRPFFYTSFVSTVDGKVWVKKKGYWPIGSKTDYKTFTFLRAHADAIIDGKKTALQFGKATIDTINSDKFQSLRKQVRKESMSQYIVVTSHPDEELKVALKNPYGFKPVIFKEGIDALVDYLNKEGLGIVFIDGGPHFLASFLEKKLLDEIFLTISPKIFGNDGSAVTMVEGKLFPFSQVTLMLLSMEKIGDEVFLCYSVKYK